MLRNKHIQSSKSDQSESPSCSQLVQQAGTSILTLRCTGPQSQDFFVSCQIDPYCCQNDRGISLISMTNGEMHAIQIYYPPVLLKRALTPGLKLLGERLVQAADRARVGSNPIRVWTTLPTFLPFTQQTSCSCGVSLRQVPSVNSCCHPLRAALIESPVGAMVKYGLQNLALMGIPAK